MRNPPNEPLTAAAKADGSEGEIGRRAADASAQDADGGGAGREGPERTCILTRRQGSRDELIRLALGPDGEVGPDVRARAPGRGAWIGVGRAQLQAALDKGRLKGALERAFKSRNLRIPPDLADRTAEALRRALLDRLGMEARAGNLLTGADRIEAAARAGGVHLLLHAADAGEDGRRRMDQAWRVGGGDGAGLVFPEGRTILSMALGRQNVVHVALTDRAAAARVCDALRRWRAFIDPEPGLDGGEPASARGSAEVIGKGTE
jgi:uncharacterized protein